MTEPFLKTHTPLTARSIQPLRRAPRRLPIGNVTEAWPFGDPRPRVYYDARALTPRPRFNMHAKCVVVDGECALVTSANFTRRAHEQNTECGVLLESSAFAHHLARQWLGLIDAGLVHEAIL